MMNKLTLLLLMLISQLVSSQAVSGYTAEIRKFQAEINREYKNAKESPLRGEHLANFRGHPFFPINSNYKVQAQFRKTPDAVPFNIPTSSGHARPYVEYGEAEFSRDGKTYTLKIYQSLELVQKPEYMNHLFLPFRDATNGKETYGGGRYLDLEIPEGDVIVIDFNKAYQPYCAYNAYDYSCPVVPAGNTLPYSVMAGVKYDDIYFK